MDGDEESVRGSVQPLFFAPKFASSMYPYFFSSTFKPEMASCCAQVRPDRCERCPPTGRCRGYWALFGTGATSDGLWWRTNWIFGSKAAGCSTCVCSYCVCVLCVTFLYSLSTFLLMRLPPPQGRCSACLFVCCLFLALFGVLILCRAGAPRRPPTNGFWGRPMPRIWLASFPVPTAAPKRLPSSTFAASVAASRCRRPQLNV